jgi:hypothetical protein
MNTLLIKDEDYKEYKIKIYEDKFYVDWKYIVKQNEKTIINNNKIYFSIFDLEDSAKIAIDSLKIK